LITGGLSGLGLEVAQWLVQRGARHLVLLGRGKPKSTATAKIQGIKEGGAQVLVAQCDISQEEQLAGICAEIAKTMPPLRGIVHSAGVADYCEIVNHDWESFSRVFPAKVAGTWNLHALTADAPLDFFLLFSSQAALLGSARQGNYAAANVFLDAFAYHRQAQGLPALSINWGPWREVGMAASQAG